MIGAQVDRVGLMKRPPSHDHPGAGGAARWTETDEPDPKPQVEHMEPWPAQGFRFNIAV